MNALVFTENKIVMNARQRDPNFPLLILFANKAPDANSPIRDENM